MVFLSHLLLFSLPSLPYNPSPLPLLFSFLSLLSFTHNPSLGCLFLLLQSIFSRVFYLSPLLSLLRSFRILFSPFPQPREYIIFNTLPFALAYLPSVLYFHFPIPATVPFLQPVALWIMQRLSRHSGHLLRFSLAPSLLTPPSSVHVPVGKVMTNASRVFR